MAEFHSTGVAVAQLARFDEFMQAYMEQDGLTRLRSAVLAIARDDRLVFARAYTLEEAFYPVAQPTSLFRIASATKPLTGTAIHQLLEAGDLKLDKKIDPLVHLKAINGNPFETDAVPADKSKPGDYFDAITIDHLLRHKSGYQQSAATFDLDVAKAFAAVKKPKNPKKPTPFKLPIDKRQWLRWVIAEKGQLFYPGNQTQYSNIGYALLGLVLERKTGRSYFAALQRRIFGPIGVTRMRGARSRETERAPGEVRYHVEPENDLKSVLETAQPIVPQPYGSENLENKDSYGGVVLSAVDYARFLASFSAARPLVKTAVKDLLFWRKNADVPQTPVKIFRHGAVLPGSAGVIGRRADGFSTSLFINTTKAKYSFTFEGTALNPTKSDVDHEIVLHRLINEAAADAWPEHDLFPLHGIPANVTDALRRDSGRLDVVMRGKGCSLFHATQAPGKTWGKWQDLDGDMASPPRIVSWGPAHLEVFALGHDRALWHRRRTKTGWLAWESLGGDLVSDPCVVSTKPNRLDVFAVGKDHDLRQFHFEEKTGWREQSLGGTLTTPPSAVSWGSDRWDVFALGSDYALWHMWHVDKAGLSEWQQLGGDLRSYPEVVSWGKGRLDVFALGADRALRHRAHDPKAGWSNWESLGGDLRCSPTAASWGKGRLDVFAVTADQQLAHRRFAGTNRWGEWEALGGILTSRPKAVSAGLGNIDVFAAGLDQAAWHLAHRPGVGWGKWTSRGGEVV